MEKGKKYLVFSRLTGATIINAKFKESIGAGEVPEIERINSEYDLSMDETVSMFERMIFVTEKSSYVVPKNPMVFIFIEQQKKLSVKEAIDIIKSHPRVASDDWDWNSYTGGN